MVQKVRRLVGYVIMTAKGKNRRNWQQDAVQSGDIERKFIGRLPTSQMKPLVIFIGGGGSKSSWYKGAIESTYTAFQHYNAHIPPYKLVEVPRPSDLPMSDHSEGGFIRFAISYGLSIPFGEGPEVRLPSQFAKAEQPRREQLPGVINYADSKDVC